MKKWLQKWLGIDNLQAKDYDTASQLQNISYLLANQNVTSQKFQALIDEIISKQTELNKLITNALAEIDGIKEGYEYHTREIWEIKKIVMPDSKPKAKTPAKKA